MYYSEEVKEFTKKLAFFPEEGKSLSGIINNIKNDTKNRRLKNSLDIISMELEKGKTFSESLDKTEELYPSHIKKIIRGGEDKKENLAETMKKIFRAMEKESRISDSIKNFLVPMIIQFDIFTVILIFLFSYVLSPFKSIFDDMNLTLPLLTGMLLSVITLFLNYLFLGIYILLILILNISIFRSNPLKSSFLYYMPVTGQIIKNYYIFHISWTGEILAGAGLTLRETLEEIEKGISFVPVKNSLNYIIEGLKKGEKLPSLIERGKFFPPVFSRLILKGEYEENLEKAMYAASVAYKPEKPLLGQRENRYDMISVILVGCIIGFVILAVFMPLYQMLSLIK